MLLGLAFELAFTFVNGAGRRYGGAHEALGIPISDQKDPSIKREERP